MRLPVVQNTRYISLQVNYLKQYKGKVKIVYNKFESKLLNSILIWIHEIRTHCSFNFWNSEG